MSDRLIDLYREAAENAFGWAQVLRSSDASYREAASAHAKIREKYSGDAERWINDYMGGMPGTHALSQQPGSPLHLIGLAFRNMQQSADEFEQWGYRLTAAHDYLAIRHSPLAP